MDITSFNFEIDDCATLLVCLVYLLTWDSNPLPRVSTIGPNVCSRLVGTPFYAL